jgi:uncharacterized protein (TIGR03067 family)
VTLPIWLLLACGLSAGFDDDAATQKERDRFEGVWRFALVEVDGVKQPEAPFASNKVIISKDGSNVIVQGPRITRGVIKLDLTKTPRIFEQTITHGPAKGRQFPCIYELTDDAYKLCGSYRGGEPPAAFATQSKSGLILQVLKREKQSVSEALIEVGRKELTGTWQAVTYALDGKKASDEEMKKVKLVFDSAGKTTAYNDGKVFIASSTQIDPTANPMTIGITFTEGPNKGKTALGIYKIEDELLTICRSAPEKPRPAEFASTPGSGLTLMTYKLEKSQAKK